MFKLYRYNKNQTPSEAFVTTNLPSLISNYNKESDLSMNRALQQILGLWISFHSDSSKEDIMRQKEANLKQLTKLVQDILYASDPHSIETMFLTLKFSQVLQLLQDCGGDGEFEEVRK